MIELSQTTVLNKTCHSRRIVLLLCSSRSTLSVIVMRLLFCFEYLASNVLRCLSLCDREAFSFSHSLPPHYSVILRRDDCILQMQEWSAAYDVRCKERKGDLYVTQRTLHCLSKERLIFFCDEDMCAQVCRLSSCSQNRVVCVWLSLLKTLTRRALRNERVKRRRQWLRKKKEKINCRISEVNRSSTENEWQSRLSDKKSRGGDMREQMMFLSLIKYWEMKDCSRSQIKDSSLETPSRSSTHHVTLNCSPPFVCFDSSSDCIPDDHSTIAVFSPSALFTTRLLHDQTSCSFKPCHVRTLFIALFLAACFLRLSCLSCSSHFSFFSILSLFQRKSFPLRDSNV